MLFSTKLRSSLLQLVVIFRQRWTHWVKNLALLGVWLRFTHSSLQACQISALNPSVGSGHRGPRKKYALDLFTSWTPLKCTLAIGIRTISYTHHRNSALPQVCVSFHCNSTGTRPTQSLPLLCWKVSLLRQKTVKVCCSAWTCPDGGNLCSHKYAAIRGKDLRFCKCRTLVFRGCFSKDIVREEETKGLELLRRPRKKNGKNTEYKNPVLWCCFSFTWFERSSFFVVFFFVRSFTLFAI